MATRGRVCNACVCVACVWLTRVCNVNKGLGASVKDLS